MRRRRQIFRISFFGHAGTLHEVEIIALDTAAAILAAREVPWPPKAIGFRIIDLEGGEVFEQLKADRR